MSKRMFFLGLALSLLLPAVYAADFQAGMSAYQNGDYETALNEFTPLAEQGDADAQLSLGIMYDNGEGVPQDYTQAVRWFRMAAEQGDARAQGHLGRMYYNGKGVPQDIVEAYAWFDLAVSQGDDTFGLSEKSRNLAARKMSEEELQRAKQRAQDYRKQYVAPFTAAPAVQRPADNAPARVAQAATEEAERIPLAIPPQPQATDVGKDFAIPVTPPISLPAAETPSAPATSERIQPSRLPISEATASTQPNTPPVPQIATPPVPEPKSPAKPETLAAAPRIPQTKPTVPLRAKLQPTEPKRASRGGAFRIQLASSQHRDRIESLWRKLQNRYQNQLGSLSLTIERAELNKGVYHRLQAGPLSKAEAQMICEQLKARKQACLVVNR